MIKLLGVLLALSLLVPVPNVKTEERIEVPINNTIKFSGYGRYVVSESSPNIKLKNPEGNSVDFIFTVKDKSSNGIIGVSEKVISGSYAEIDLKHYYNKIGTYKIKIEISTLDSLGNKCSGLGQELDLIVK